MKLAKYWTRETCEELDLQGRTTRVSARGWSNESMEAARALAVAIAQRLAHGDFPDKDKQYLYGGRALPEPVLREFNGDGQRAIVTRNIYGAEVLNTRDLMFVDIDKPHQPGAALAGRIRSLFSKAPADPPELTKIQEVAERNNLSGHVYGTAGGYRVLITSSRFTPGDSPSEDLLRQFDADPLYIRLCRLQESFRARLTPKPWRCGLQTPPVVFPFVTPVQQSRFDAWESTYTATAQRFATCRYIRSFGSGSVASGFADLVQFHDAETRATSSLPLA
jgi:hypothetical protein